MKIQLDLADHCIETEVRRRHEAAISRYFRVGMDKAAIEAELVLLEKALVAFDFPALRHRWPLLAGGAGGTVWLTWDNGGRPRLLFGDRRIVPPAQEAG